MCGPGGRGDRCSVPTGLLEAGMGIFGPGWQPLQSSDSGLSVLGWEAHVASWG